MKSQADLPKDAQLPTTESKNITGVEAYRDKDNFLMLTTTVYQGIGDLFNFIIYYKEIAEKIKQGKVANTPLLPIVVVGEYRSKKIKETLADSLKGSGLTPPIVLSVPNINDNNLKVMNEWEELSEKIVADDKVFTDLLSKVTSVAGIAVPTCPSLLHRLNLNVPGVYIGEHGFRYLWDQTRSTMDNREKHFFTRGMGTQPGDIGYKLTKFDGDKNPATHLKAMHNRKFVEELSGNKTPNEFAASTLVAPCYFKDSPAHYQNIVNLLTEPGLMTDKIDTIALYVDRPSFEKTNLNRQQLIDRGFTAIEYHQGGMEPRKEILSANNQTPQRTLKIYSDWDLDDNDYHALYKMAPIAGCSGDNTFEMCLQYQCLPLWDVAPWKMNFFEQDFIPFVLDNGDENRQKLIDYFKSTYSAKDFDPMHLDPKTYQAVRKSFLDIASILYEEYNAYDHTEKILHEIDLLTKANQVSWQSLTESEKLKLIEYGKSCSLLELIAHTTLESQAFFLINILNEKFKEKNIKFSCENSFITIETKDNNVQDKLKKISELEVVDPEKGVFRLKLKKKNKLDILDIPEKLIDFENSFAQPLQEQKLGQPIKRFNAAVLKADNIVELVLQQSNLKKADAERILNFALKHEHVSLLTAFLTHYPLELGIEDNENKEIKKQEIINQLYDLAIKSDDLKLLGLLTEKYPSANTINGLFSFPYLNLAIKANSLSVIQFIVEKNPQLLTQVDEDGKCPLYYAFDERKEATAKLLIELDKSGTSFDLCEEGSSYKYNPFAEAVSVGYTELCMKMLEKRQEIKLEKNSAKTINELFGYDKFVLAEAFVRNHGDLSKLLLNTGFDLYQTKEIGSVIQDIIDRGNNNSIHALTQLIDLLKAKTHLFNFVENMTVYSNFNNFAAFLDALPAAHNLKDENNISLQSKLLQKALKDSSLRMQIITYFVDRKLDIKQVNVDGKNIFNIAVDSLNVNLFKLIAPIAPNKSDFVMDFLINALSKNQSSNLASQVLMINEILNNGETSKAFVDKMSDEQKQAVLNVFLKISRLTISPFVSELINNVNQESQIFRQALKENNNSIVEFMLAAHPQLVNQLDEKGNSILSLAVTSGDVNLVKTILKYHPNLESASVAFMNAAANPNSIPITKLLIDYAVERKKDFLELRDPYGFNALLAAAEKQNQEIVLYLMEKGVDYTATHAVPGKPENSQHFSALHLAEAPLALEIINFDKEGKIINLQDFEGTTALMNMMMKPNIDMQKASPDEVIRALLRHPHIQLDLKNNKDETAFMQALKMRRIGLVNEFFNAMLEKAVSQPSSIDIKKYLETMVQQAQKLGFPGIANVEMRMNQVYAVEQKPVVQENVANVATTTAKTIDSTARTLLGLGADVENIKTSQRVSPVEKSASKVTEAGQKQEQQEQKEQKERQDQQAQSAQEEAKQPAKTVSTNFKPS